MRRDLTAVGIRVLLGPMLDLASEPRWARTIGTLGATPELGSDLGKTFVDTLIGSDLTTGVAPMIKHFPGAGPQKDGEDAHFPYGREQVYPGDFFEAHLQPFTEALSRGVTQVMPYYALPAGLTRGGERIEEVGFAFNRQIITELLRQELGFDGIVRTDFGLVTDSTVLDAPRPACAWGVEHLDHHDRVLRILEAGCDQLGGETCSEIVVDLVRSGRLSEVRLDASVLRVLSEKERLGLFDQRSVNIDTAAETIASPHQHEQGRRAQRTSIVVLRGHETLPLTPTTRVYGEGIARCALERVVQVVHRPEDADLIIARIDAPFEERTVGFESFFRAGGLDFHTDRLDTLSRHAPVLVDVYLDRPAILAPIAERAAALTVSFGSDDDALLAALTGDAESTGSLPVQIPASMNDVRNQREDVPLDSPTPLHSFGHGCQQGPKGRVR